MQFSGNVFVVVVVVVVVVKLYVGLQGLLSRAAVLMFNGSIRPLRFLKSQDMGHCNPISPVDC